MSDAAPHRTLTALSLRPSALLRNLSLRPSALLRDMPLRMPSLGKGLLPRDLMSGFGTLSDRRLRRTIDLPLLDRDPGEDLDSIVRAQVVAVASGFAAGAEATDLLHLIQGWEAARSATAFGRRKARLAAGQLLSSDIAARLAAQGPEHPVTAALTAQACLLQGRHALKRAEALLDRFDPAACASPLLAEVQYRLSALAAEGVAALQDAHDDWADLDPSDRAVWHGHARLMLAQGATVADIAAAAARCEWQTERWWGKGGYALFLLPVMHLDMALWDRIDPERLAAAALDLARHRRKDQGAVNRLAAGWHRLVPMAPAAFQPMMRTTWRQMLEESLNALLPAAWDGGQTAARRAIAGAFAAEMKAGACLRATPAGLALCDRSAA
jgi:hypothetical protein